MIGGNGRLAVVGETVGLQWSDGNCRLATVAMTVGDDRSAATARADLNRRAATARCDRHHHVPRQIRNDITVSTST